MPTRETETNFRKPFTPEELKAILGAARHDDFIRPIITGIYTAMRRGACCLLKWADVDMRRRFITVKTAKTGVLVSIPIFPQLYEELARQPDTGSPMVSPAAAEMYRNNQTGITLRVRKVFAAAGFKDAEEEKIEMKDGKLAIQHRGESHAERVVGLRRASVRDLHIFQARRLPWP